MSAPNIPNLSNLAPLQRGDIKILNEIAITMLRTEHATKRAAAASIASGMIAASGRPHSIEEATDLALGVFHRMFPDPSQGSYLAWKESADLTSPHE